MKYEGRTVKHMLAMCGFNQPDGDGQDRGTTYLNLIRLPFFITEEVNNEANKR